MKNNIQTQEPIATGMAKAESNITNIEKRLAKTETNAEKIEERLRRFQ